MNTPHLHPSVFASLPEPETLRRHLADFERASNRIAREREEMGFGSRSVFGSRIAAAVRIRTEPRPRAVASAEPSENGDTFGEQLKREVQKRSPQKQHEQQQKKERDRYKPIRRRAHTKSD